MDFARNLVGVAAIAALVGCTATGISEEKDALEAAQTATPELALPEFSAPLPPIRGTPTEIYTRIARGAVTCWFGAHGQLKDTHVYHAIAKPPSKGGRARILIHERDNSLRDKRGTRAFAINVLPSGKSAKLEFQNARMGEPRGREMAATVRRWAAGLEGCLETPVAAGWDTDANRKSATKGR